MYVSSPNKLVYDIALLAYKVAAFKVQTDKAT